MLRRLRRKLRLIDYYSARRERTAWSRAMDAALPLTFLMALPMTWLMDVAVVRQHEAGFLTGAIGQRPDRSIHAEVIDENTSQAKWLQGAQLGNFELAMIDHHHGWPTTTSIVQPGTALHLNMFDQPGVKRFAAVDSLDPSLRKAIEAAVEAAPQGPVRSRWGVATPPAQIIVWSWAAGALLWWVMLFFLCAAGIQVARAFAAWGVHRGARRATKFARSGYCANCGYNLKGLEWSERCPECGELAE